MNKTIKSGTRINETVAAVEKALVGNSVVLTATGNAISKAITIAEIVQRNAVADSITQSNQLSKAPWVEKPKTTSDSEVPGGPVGEEGEFKEVEAESDVHAFQQAFVASEMDQRHRLLDALIETFRPSDYRHVVKKLYPDRFVGDMMTLLPTELIDIILNHLEPQYIYTLRNVSSIWNNYLSSTELMQTMYECFYGSNGRYILDKDNPHSPHKTLHQRVRNRCAMRNGQARSFDLICHAVPGHSLLSYSHGTLVNWSDNAIFVTRLADPEHDWHLLRGQDFEVFRVVSATPDYIIALTKSRKIYCWSTDDLELVAQFKVPSEPYELSASKDTLVIFDVTAWYFYHVPTKTLSHHGIDWFDTERDTVHTVHVERTGFIYTVHQDGTIKTLRLSDDGTTVDRVSTQNVNLLLLSASPASTDVDAQFDKEADGEEEGGALNIIVVWNHATLYASPITIAGAPTRVYALWRGTLTYHHTIQNENTRPNELICVPELRVAYDLVCEHGRGMPLGLYRVVNDNWSPVSPDHCRPDQSRLRARLSGGSPQGRPEREAGPVVQPLEDTSWALAYEDPHSLWTGDANYLICSQFPAAFTRIWKFYDDEDHTQKVD
ncbi:F-box domain protein [Taphrina deformans PYCC 5710]|uniref:F-box domain protein n=1 Tax=Taphrina deformans (strain PYCC 5710 / ATCC 11124 / CBS 356.35 / IMI 108563 / JCM 9778 / NBRC 8474) TaxID=1097556 RepID=R4XB65_TAPDE|nr:F-box domain protein [Taphrina deformans PYCC 5710]|eukprot:CCG80558.1 F-box domain protein [Taphrina deformans PYCC 5710]